MRTIKLTKGKRARVDDEIFDWLSQWKWFAFFGRSVWYAARWSSRRGGKRQMILMHRQIIGLDARDRLQVDHFDGVGLNNVRTNLRIATKRQNTWNMLNRRKGQSGFHGVTWHAQRKRWQARIRIDAGYKSLGLFENPLEAARAYNRAVREHRGTFGRINEKTLHEHASRQYPRQDSNLQPPAP